MEVLSLCELPAFAFTYRPGEDQIALVIACKATFPLAPGVLALADAQEPILAHDQYWEDDPQKSLQAPSDLVPRKGLADVLVVGYAYAPRKEPARSLVAQITVGEMRKAIEVHGQRFVTPDGTLREGAAWTRMPLRYERAAGGPMNPVGMRLDAPPDAYGQRALPYLQPPGFRPSRSSNVVPTVGFGPIAPSWPARRDKWGPPGALPGERWHEKPLSDSFDADFFQSAPRDQQVGALRPGERVTLDHLHPEHERLVFQLPKSFPRAFSTPPGGAPREIAMPADTLWIDTARAIVTLTFRAEVPLERPDQPGLLILALDPPGERSSLEQVAERARMGHARPVPRMTPSASPAPEVEVEDTEVTRRKPSRAEGPAAQESTLVMAPGSSRPTSLAGMVTRGREDADVVTVSVVKSMAPAPPLPFRPSAQASPVAGLPPRPPAPPRPAGNEQTAAVPVESLVSAPGLPPWLAQRKATEPARPAPARPSAPPPPIAPPPIAPPPIAPPPIAPPPIVPPPIASPPIASPPIAPPPIAPPVTPRPRGAHEPKDLAAAAFVGAAAASDAAADRFEGGARGAGRSPGPESKASGSGAAPVAPAPPKQPPTISLELVFFEAELAPKLRKHPEWAKLVSAPRRPVPPRKTSLLGWSIGGPDEGSSAGGLSQSDIIAVLSKGTPATAQSLYQAMMAYFEGAGGFDAPLGLLAGELEFPYEPLEELNAIVQAATPLSLNDKRLEETLGTVTEVMKTPLDSAPDVIEDLIRQVREAWIKANKLLPSDYLASSIERTLLEQRKYQRRDLLDGSWIRSLLAVEGEEGRIPVYLPMHLYRKLPLFKRFPARLLGEALPQQDQYETHPIAIKAVALARALPAMQRQPSR